MGVPVGTCGCSCGYLWVLLRVLVGAPVGTCGCLWVLVGACGCLWVLVGACGCSCVCLLVPIGLRFLLVVFNRKWKPSVRKDKRNMDVDDNTRVIIT